MARKGALDPSGLVLYDKPAGPSSFAIVRQLREQTGARAGHAGTLDPFATGLLLVLLGSFTKEAQRFVGLEKRYETAVDLSRTTSTGDPEGEVVDEHEAPSLLELEAQLDALRGEVDLKIPAASAVKIGGERAYKLHRRGVAVEMPTRRTTVYELDARGVRGADGAAFDAPELRRLRAGDRRGARRPLREPAPHARRPVRRRRRRPEADHRPPADAVAAPSVTA